MIFLYTYLGIGAVVLAIIYLAHRLTRSSADKEIEKILAAVNPDPRKNRWWWKPLNNGVVPILAAGLVLPIWPLMLYRKSKEIIHARHSKTDEPFKEFAVTQDHLLKSWTIAEIEVAETVVDPLGAAPSVPFGHLNQAWERFKQSIQEGDQLWSFSAPWITEWGHHEERAGYVVVRGNSPGPYFLTRNVLVEKSVTE